MFVYTGMIGVYDFFRTIKLLREEICGRFILSPLLGSGPTRRWGDLWQPYFPEVAALREASRRLLSASAGTQNIQLQRVLTPNSGILTPPTPLPQSFMKQLKDNNHDVLLRRKDPTLWSVKRPFSAGGCVWGRGQCVFILKSNAVRGLLAASWDGEFHCGNVFYSTQE